MFGWQPDLEIDVPFEYRHVCWFCGEPGKQAFHFPHDGHLVISCPHPSLVVPACSECYTLAAKANVNNIWQVFAQVKQALLHLYRKDLAIGINWTPEALAESEFEGGSFDGFKRSAWFMYEVAKGRVNFQAWPICLNGKNVEPMLEKPAFVFDGMQYPSIDDAISHYSTAFHLSVNFFYEVVAKVGIERFAYAVRFCRLYVGATPQELRMALKDLG